MTPEQDRIFALQFRKAIAEEKTGMLTTVSTVLALLSMVVAVLAICLSIASGA